MSAFKMYATHAAVLHGVEAQPVTVEVSVSQGIPGMTIVGLADTSVMEARYRIRCALRDHGFEMPRANVTVNLAPSEIRKSGTGFDLPIAVAILACTGQIPIDGLDECMFVGELALSGEVRPVRGLVAFNLLAQEQHLTLVCANELFPSKSNVLVCEHMIDLLRGVRELPVPTKIGQTECVGKESDAGADFSDVVDQEMAKRAFVIAAAGNHGLLMVGPPGSGKSMMAKRMPSILPLLTEQERSEVMLIHSAAGQGLVSILAGERPFRAPHHGVSRAGLIGGGRPVTPGEVSLAHRGVLFLDELPEFGPSTLQALRQPLEDGVVRVVRVDGTYAFPCQFMLVAAANPCPCGYLGDPDHHCTCSPARIQAYQGRIGGPLMDRIDVLVDVARPSPTRIIAGDGGTSSHQMAEEVASAREFASWRRRDEEDQDSKAAKTIAALDLSSEAQLTLDGMARRLGLGGRNIVRIARVARTIADLAESQTVSEQHVIEACAFRTRATL